MSAGSPTSASVLGLLREMTGESVLLSEAIAREAGLSPADLEVLGLVQQHGSLTAGRLSELTGLSAAAVTGLIDRLENAGVARRRTDSEDRRRVLVELSEGARQVAGLYGTLERDALEVLSKRTPRELRVIDSFLREMLELSVEHTNRLERRGNRG